MPALDVLLADVRACTICADHLPHGIRPVVQVHASARILIAGQAPGRRVHESGVPFYDPSGDRLREWMGVSREVFYDATKIAILPMGFCYPGTGNSGDLPPPPRMRPRLARGPPLEAEAARPDHRPRPVRPGLPPPRPRKDADRHRKTMGAILADGRTAPTSKPAQQPLAKSESLVPTRPAPRPQEAYRRPARLTCDTWRYRSCHQTALVGTPKVIISPVVPRPLS